MREHAISFRPQQQSPVPKTRTRKRGFTLVELLVVITIIGVLAGLAVKGIAVGRKMVAEARLSMEVSELAKAVEAYRQKYHDYPPDFSDPKQVERHFRKAFPKILNSELLLLNNAINRYFPVNEIARGVDPAEALVFCLGGFSDDPQRPFTGKGGPLSVLPAPAHANVDRNNNNMVDGVDLTFIDNYQYNSDRNVGQFEFDITRLTLVADVIPLRSSDDYFHTNPPQKPVWDVSLGNNDTGNALSSSDYAPTVIADPFPVYRPRDKEMPYVYFNSRTYAFVGTIRTGSGSATGYYFNNFVPRPLTAGDDYRGVVRPYKSTQVNTTAISAIPSNRTPTLAEADGLRFYEKKDSFQIICAGLDDHFGGVLGFIDGSPVNFIAGTGEGFRAGLVVSNWPSNAPATLGVDSEGREFKYNISNLAPNERDVLEFAGNPQQDNLTNFSEGQLINGIP